MRDETQITYGAAAESTRKKTHRLQTDAGVELGSMPSDAHALRISPRNFTKAITESIIADVKSILLDNQSDPLSSRVSVVISFDHATWVRMQIHDKNWIKEPYREDHDSWWKLGLHANASFRLFSSETTLEGTRLDMRFIGHKIASANSSPVINALFHDVHGQTLPARVDRRGGHTRNVVVVYDATQSIEDPRDKQRNEYPLRQDYRSYDFRGRIFVGTYVIAKRAKLIDHYFSHANVGGEIQSVFSTISRPACFQITAESGLDVPNYKWAVKKCTLLDIKRVLMSSSYARQGLFEQKNETDTEDRCNTQRVCTIS